MLWIPVNFFDRPSLNITFTFLQNFDESSSVCRHDDRFRYTEYFAQEKLHLENFLPFLNSGFVVFPTWMATGQAIKLWVFWANGQHWATWGKKQQIARAMFTSPMDVNIRGQWTSIVLCFWPLSAWWQASKQTKERGGFKTPTFITSNIHNV